MKRFISLLLAVVMAVGMLTGISFAADSTATIQEALVETAKAYWYKGKAVQYDSSQMTHQTRLTHGESRISSGTAPEWASAGDTLFSVCSDFVFDVYYNATGYEVMGGSRNAITSKMARDLDPKEPTLVYLAGGKSTTPIENFRESLSLLQPGDIITYYRSTKSGHATMYVGDIDGDGKGDIMHCNGKKMDIFASGEDALDNERGGKGGAIRVDSAESLLYGEKPIDNPKVFTAFSVMRPTKLGTLTLTDSAKTRLQFKGIGADRRTELNQYNSVKVGDEVTVTVTVQNNGTADFKGVTVKEVLPVGGTVKEGSVSEGGKLAADGITWTVDVPAGKETKVSYVVTVTGKQGTTLTLPSGTVEALTTRPMTHTIGGAELSAANLDKFKAVRQGTYDTRLKNMKFEGDLGFVNSFYKMVFSLDLGLPANLQGLVDNMFTPTKLDGVGKDYWDDQMLIPKKLGQMSAPYQRISTMLIPEHIAGFCVSVRDDPFSVPKMMGAQNRVLEILPEFYAPGDVFVGYKHKNRESFTVYQPDVYVYLGNNKVVGFTAGGEVSVEAFSDTIALMLRHDVMFALRPTLAYKDINTAKPMVFSDVTEADWFQPYVRGLVADGVVAGMTETTYAPKGTLTWGQALKLICVGLGKGEQPAGAHWASGYADFAKKSGWLSADVDLNGAISRLDFCKVAAKAAGVTAQPASNPFTDCTDTDVLALVNAGVINGMTETTFAPNETLTRAQIAKIIWLMNNI